MHRVWSLVVVSLVALASDSVRAQCFALPFGNPNLDDGWGSTCCGRSNPHRGLDFAQAPGTAIPSVADGVVRLRTSTGCLGNVVVIEHDDGIFSGYAHMSAQSPLAEGSVVAQGETIGTVGNTGSCTTGPHLHLTIAPSLDGYTFGETYDPYAFITANQTCDAAPVGYLDTATCTGITGWTQDTDDPDVALDVHVYVGGPAGDPSAYGFPVRADLHREDLCAAIGSCAHGFSVSLPLAFFDGVERPIFAYGIGTGGTNALLANAPRTLRCESAPLPTDAEVRRHVPSMDSFASWRFNAVDVAPLADDVIHAVALGDVFEGAPALVRAADDANVYVRDGAFLRLVEDPTVMSAWRFDFAAVVVVEAIDVATIDAPWPRLPFLTQDSDGAIWVLDAARLHTDDPDGEDGTDDTDGTDGTEGTDVTDESAGPSVTSCTTGSHAASALFLFALACVRKRLRRSLL